MATIQTGKGKHRRRDAGGWSDSESEQEIEEEIRTELPPEKEVEKQPKPNEDAKEDVDFDRLRDESRKNYLLKRHDSKLEELEKELQQLNGKAPEEYQRKLKVYELLKLRIELSESAGDVNNLYNLPSDYVTNQGKIDRKRKHDLLTVKAKDYDVDEEEDNSKRSQKNGANRYENQWELDQLKKAQGLSSVDGANIDKIQFAGQGDYEFVFDDSQFVDFTDDEEGLDGDDEPDNQAETTSQTYRNKIEETRKSLPVYKFRESFLESIDKHQVLIVVGETGSGKTTQLPQYLHEAGYSKGINGNVLQIGCTQPRKVAATSVAARVADEMGVNLGAEVGYNVRFDDNTSKKTIVKYLTDGMLLREFLNDPILSNYGALMVDEAHERTVSTEIILSLLKDIIRERSDLKLIIASATINAQKFSDFFDGALIFNIPGRRFPVDIHYTKNPEANYIQAAITTIFQIHTTQDTPGDILVFLTGQEEIETMEEALVDATVKLGSLIKNLIVAPIYANLPPNLQKKIFEPTPPNSRKVVLATNIAETSITINGISYVIDPGYVKENVFNPVTGMESLVVVPCSRASADQRAGRAGRVGPGKCFRLYTKWSFYNELQANPTPEILRVNLTSIVLLLLSLGISDLIGFEFMDPPSSDTLIKSLELLYALGALNSKGELTKTGRKMAEFPIDPMFSKSLIKSSDYGVSEEILSIIALLSESSSLFYRPKNKKEEADKKKEIFNHTAGDHLTLLNIWEQWADTSYSNLWCEDNFIQYKTLKRARDIREQLSKLCNRTGILLDNDDNEPKNPDDKLMKIQKSITAGFFPNIARLGNMGDSYQSLKKNQPVYIHPSSALYSVKPPPKLLLYHELVLTSKEYMRNCMLIDSKWLVELAPHYYSKKELDGLNGKAHRYK